MKLFLLAFLIDIIKHCFEGFQLSFMLFFLLCFFILIKIKFHKIIEKINKK